MDVPCAQFQADLDITFSKKGKSVVLKSLRGRLV